MQDKLRHLGMRDYIYSDYAADVGLNFRDFVLEISLYIEKSWKKNLKACKDTVGDLLKEAFYLKIVWKRSFSWEWESRGE